MCQVVTEYKKNAMLRKDHVFLIKGSVFEMENQSDFKSIAVGHLSDFALGEDFAFKASQGQESVEQSFDVQDFWRHRRFRVGR